MSKVQARLTVLTPNQIQEVHQQSLKILAGTGIRIDSERALEIFVQAGATCDGNRVRLSATFVDQALASAPSAIEIFDQTGEPAFTLTPIQETLFGIGVTNTSYQDSQTDEIQPFTREHASLATRLGNTLEQFDLVSTPGVIQDERNSDPEVLTLLEMLANTTKPLVMLMSSTPQFDRSLELLKHLYGDLSQKPFVMPYFNPITPLVLNEDTTDKMISTIAVGLPMIFSSYGMSGATTPITSAGTLVLLNAELLAGLVFAQLVKPGTPVILGSLPAVFEMKYMTSTYTSQTNLLNLACAEMMAHYGIPHAGTSGSGAGWGPDLPASGGLWMNHLTSCLGQSGLAPFVGGNFDSLVFSPAMIVYANEVIRQSRLFAAGFELDVESIDPETITSTGPGGNFFTSPQTMSLFQELDQQHSKIWPAYPLEQWISKGAPPADSVLRSSVKSILENLETPNHHDDILGRGEAWLEGNHP